MKRVLITGALGSCGSYLAEHLVDQGYEVVGLARRLGSRSHANLEAVKGLISLVDCDLCDHKTLDSIFEKTPFDGVFHVASFAHVDRSFQSIVRVAQPAGRARLGRASRASRRGDMRVDRGGERFRR